MAKIAKHSVEKTLGVFECFLLNKWVSLLRKVVFLWNVKVFENANQIVILCEYCVVFKSSIISKYTFSGKKYFLLKVTTFSFPFIQSSQSSEEKESNKDLYGPL